MLLRIRDLRTHFVGPDGVAPAVDGVSLEIARRRTVALVGESGCGKSVTALSILRLVPPPGRIVGGEIMFEGRDLLKLDEREARRIRGGRIAMIFQEPMTSLNPVLSAGAQIGEALRLHRGLRGRASRKRAVELLQRVGIPAAEALVDDYPHKLSGGMRQRVMIAMALACEPALLIADEPTTALDVTIEAQILDLLRDLQQQSGMSILLITHDLSLVAGSADAVYVMYAGRIVEQAPVARLFADPRHPYTQALLGSIPRQAPDQSPERQRGAQEPGAERTAVGISSESPEKPRADAQGSVVLRRAKRRLAVIPGEVPRPASRPEGCAFHPRCVLGRDDATCQTRVPVMAEVAHEHQCACWKRHAQSPGELG